MALVDGKKEKILGIDLDPEDRLKMNTDKEGYPSCTIDNKKCSTSDYLDAAQENAERHFKGKKSKSFGYFGGFGKGTLKKPYAQKKIYNN
tara:strand:- start:455 stop:724 length:270 start_codon:yes stop_codon:yes gene_type:complete